MYRDDGVTTEYEKKKSTGKRCRSIIPDQSAPERQETSARHLYL